MSKKNYQTWVGVMLVANLQEEQNTQSQRFKILRWKGIIFLYTTFLNGKPTYKKVRYVWNFSCTWLVLQLPRTWAGTNLRLKIYLVFKTKYVMYGFPKGIHSVTWKYEYRSTAIDSNIP
jgi:hypothetical protein